MVRAKSELDQASASKLLAKRYAKAAQRLRELTSRELAAKSAKAKPAERPKVIEPTPLPKPAQDTSAALLEEGKRLMRDKQYPAAKVQLERCIRATPKNADCHKLLGTAWAKLNDSEKGAREYREFIRLAPPDHPDIDKVKAILSAFETGK